MLCMFVITKCKERGNLNYIYKKYRYNYNLCKVFFDQEKIEKD